MLILALAAVSARADEISGALARMYNFDFPAAHRHIDRHIAANPNDPLGPTFRAAADLFYELDRLKILEGEFFASDKRISGKEKLTPDPDVRARFFRNLEAAQKLADGALAAKPSDTNALFACSLAEGMRTDYTAFIEKKQLRSLSSAKKAHSYATALLARDPGYVDAYLTTGVTEYLVGSLPFFVKWFVRFEGVEGSKQQAVANLEKVARSGRYLGPFARILLSIVHLREKRYTQCENTLSGLVKDFPENRLLRNEWDKVRVKSLR